MKRIKKIEISNYKAFKNDYTFDLKDGKNLLIYGENGSGKSSFCLALNNFFEASDQRKKSLRIENFTNKFSSKEGNKNSSIKVHFINDKTGYEFNNSGFTKEDISLIKDANKLKGYLNYKNLLSFYLVPKNQSNLFRYFVEGPFRNLKYLDTNKLIATEWNSFPKNKVPNEFYQYIFKLAKKIEPSINQFLKYFDKNIKVEFKKSTTYTTRKLYIQVYTNGLKISNYGEYFNEAKLNALSLSIYFAIILLHKDHHINRNFIAPKLLILDDIFIGLDMGNRLPLLRLLNDNFINVDMEIEYQLFMTTYDKVWYELIKNFYGEAKWKYIEFYPKKVHENEYDIPVLIDSENLIEKAEKYFKIPDYKASAVYIRSEFERLAKSICEKNSIKVPYKRNGKNLKSETFWQNVVQNIKIDPELVAKIDRYKSIVMNPYSHDDIDKPMYEQELEGTIETVKEIKLKYDKKGAEKFDLPNDLKEKENEIKNLKKELKHTKLVLEDIKRVMKNKK